MPAYKLTFSCNTRQAETSSLSSEKANAITSEFRKDRAFPHNVLAVLEGETFKSGYASVSLLASFLNKDASMAHIDAYFLDNVLAAFSDTTGSDDNSWELTEIIEI